MKKTAKKTTARKVTLKQAEPKSADIISIILQDHKPLKDLIETMKSEDKTPLEKRKAFEEFAPLLQRHAKPEESALYSHMKDVEDLRLFGFEGDTEHGIADELVETIQNTKEASAWEAKVKVLAELVEHHIEEEEEEIFPEVKDNFPKEMLMQMGEEYVALRDKMPLPDTQERNTRISRSEEMMHS